ncbi:AAEL006405-PA, partial [Aedes aegypti]
MEEEITKLYNEKVAKKRHQITRLYTPENIMNTLVAQPIIGDAVSSQLTFINKQPVSIKSEPDWNDLLLPEPDGRQYGLHPQQQMHYNPLPQAPQQHHQPPQHPMQQQQQPSMRNGNLPGSLQQQQPPQSQQQAPQQQQPQPQQQQQQQPLSNDPVDNEPLDIIENVDSDDNDFAEAESLTLQQYK